jgi:TPR repeat protein
MILASIYSGVLEKSLKDRDKQHYWYERAAERGVTDALAPLAEHYARAIGTERDLDRANVLLERYYRERHALAVQARARQAAEEIATELGVKLPPSLR